MAKKLSKSELVDKFLSETPKEFEYFIQHSMDISVKIIELLKKHKLTQREIAAKLGKSESEISKWLSGNHNLTLKSIAKLEAIFDEQFLFTESEAFEIFNNKIDVEPTRSVHSLDKIVSSFPVGSSVSFKVGTKNEYNSTNVQLTEKTGSFNLYPITKEAA